MNFNQSVTSAVATAIGGQANNLLTDLSTDSVENVFGQVLQNLSYELAGTNTSRQPAGDCSQVHHGRSGILNRALPGRT